MRARRIDQLPDLLGRCGGALCKIAHLLRHDSKALAGLARACRLNASIQRQKVRLKGDAVDDGDDVGDFAGGMGNGVHGGDGAVNDLAGALGVRLRRADEAARLIGPLAGVRARRGDFLERCGTLLQRGGLLLRALRKLVCGDTDLRRAGGDDFRVLRHGLHRNAQLLDDLVEVASELLHARHEWGVEPLAQIAFSECAQCQAKRRDRTHAWCHVGGKFHHLHHRAAVVEDRVIGRLDPDLFAIFAKSDELVGDEFAGGQPSPEIAIGLRGGIGLLAEHAVMTALDIV